jgi:hypothetical protein
MTLQSKTLFAVCLKLNSEFSDAHQLLSIHSTQELARIEALKYNHCLSKICIIKTIIDAPYYQETVELFSHAEPDYANLIKDKMSFKKYIKQCIKECLQD